jgi:hypothetical protein
MTPTAADLKSAEIAAWSDLAQSIDDDVTMDFGAAEHIRDLGYSYPFTIAQCANEDALLGITRDIGLEISSHHP